MEKWDRSVLDINATVTKLGEKCQGILGMHALSGCDTVSYPSGKGKISALKVLLENDMPGLDTVLGEDDSSQCDLVETGTSFFNALYGQKKSVSVNRSRCEIFCSRKNPPPLKCLPPTDVNLGYHIQRAHLQVMLWKAADRSSPPAVQITDYGWEIKANNDVMPVLSKEPIAPGQLMDVISCNCKAEGTACSKRCSCLTNGLSCTHYCFCEGGESCSNPLTQQYDDEIGDEGLADENEDVESDIDQEDEAY